MPWEIDLPGYVSPGDPGHAALHNDAHEAIAELRDQVNLLAARIEALEGDDG